MSQENNFIPSQDSYKPLTPFRLFVKSNFPFIENTFEALDNYGLYCKVVEHLNDVIENENTVEDNVTALYNAFVSLNNYVSNYFDNLDVQEEINNKLDEMATTGELQEIVSNLYANLQSQISAISYGGPYGVYSTVDALTSADPDHSKTYVVTADGKWYYYNSSNNTWTAGGTYQSAGVDLDVSLDVNTKAPNSQIVGGRIKLIDSIIGNKLDVSLFEGGGLSDYGTNNNYTMYRFRTKNILYCNDDLLFEVPQGIIAGYHTFQADGTHLAWSGWLNTYQIIQFKVPKNTYFRMIFKRSTEDVEEVINYAPIVADMNLYINKTKTQPIINNYVSNQLDINSFINADIVNGNLNTGAVYRIASHYIFEFPDDTLIEVPYGYRMGYHTYNASTLAWSTWSGWKTIETNCLVPKNTPVRLLIAQATDGQTTLSISDTIPLFKCHSNRIDPDRGNILQSYGSARVVFPQDYKPLFTFGASYAINVTLTSDRIFVYLPSALANEAFKTITLSTLSYDIPNNNLLVYDIENSTLAVKTQSQFVQNRNNFILLLWNHYGNIKGQWLDYYMLQTITSTNYINDDSVTYEITSRQGEVDGYPENTLQGFKRAKQFGYNHIRVSVGWTSDGVAICSHANQVAGSTLRNLDGTEISDESIELENLTYEYITEHYDAGIYKGSQFAGISVPTFESVLKQAKMLNQKIDIEYKFGYTLTNLENLLEMVYVYGMQDKAIYSTNSSTQIYYVKNSDNAIKVALIGHLNQEIVTMAIQNEVNRFDMFDYDTYDDDLVLQLHQNNISVKVGSAYTLVTAKNFIEKYDVIECANQVNPIYVINRE